MTGRTPASAAAGASPLRHLPNLITLLRILLVLPLGWCLLERRFDVALALAAVAGGSDALDGFLARHYGWRSRLGGLLDPAADKLLLATCFLGLSMVGSVPWALTLLVLGRDVAIVAGALAWQRLFGALEAQPTLLSKFTTLAQILYVLAMLLELDGIAALALAPLRWAVVALTVASGVDYVLRWSLKARRLRREGGRG
ncbi:CDP-diacylglycerol--glycerol-3-phosphate 3-phosphatidyltransferase [Mizugakiibacter sediminis]|uniref:CDP-diacylglycerol--glycerol-3-phosphate 3-phosphatidyltransferase n=1 Tax=Mizugakiibacter sediminis TaxID=1475481 RepID=A0A0K8QNM7_9GAMM|nr:CDP-alcohol phosphatidyltransferase family protein [Mizugakiibacter sediminis]GAP66483.1 CDP-diacylglycerol--glycerol-3-phosphate 3-phosphatidyltransferase [Mizugakiibacter sediminis]